MRFSPIVAAAAALALGCMPVGSPADPAPALSPLPTPIPSPVPSPAATPTSPTISQASPSPAVTLHGVLSGTLAMTSGVNAVGSFDSPSGMDSAARVNVSNAFVLLAKTQGVMQFALQGGAYSIPTIGVAGNKTTAANANTGLFGPLPLAQLSYVPTSNFSLNAGILATLTGAESTYTYLNWNVQRGAVWNVENAVSRGVRASFSSGKFTYTLGANDGFWSGKFGAAEGSLTFAPDSSDSLLFVALIPNSRTPGNPTASVANKELLNLVLTRTRGNLQLAPYILYTRSPAAPSLGYAGPESAFGAAFLANLTLSGHFTTAFRYETLHDASTINDKSANADLVGFGPGSGINTYTLTPQWSNGHTFVRVDFSTARVTSSADGLAFGGDGDQRNQSRVVLEIGTQI
ncbi:MAG TPA: outer membrane beta-barrel protein [Candidatus Eremiobacteraceae bacterium]|nr:outer membrane beta-barrel protein [Candidatus Eremiobacteraceae bacterium]